jgi:energy-coupling factor transport system permease protein
VGAYAILDDTTPRYLATPVLVSGLAVGVAGVRLSGRGVRRSSYRPDRWRTAEVVTSASGLTTGLVLFVSASVDALHLYPSLSPLSWPQLPALPLLAILVALLPAFVTPVPMPVEGQP